MSIHIKPAVYHTQQNRIVLKYFRLKMYWLQIIIMYLLCFQKGWLGHAILIQSRSSSFFLKVFRRRWTQFLCPMIVYYYLSKIDLNTEIILKSRVEKLLCGQKWTCAKKWQNSTNYNHSSSHHNALWEKSVVKVAKSSFSQDLWIPQKIWTK